MQGTEKHVIDPKRREEIAEKAAQSDGDNVDRVKKCQQIKDLGKSKLNRAKPKWRNRQGKDKIQRCNESNFGKIQASEMFQ